MIQTAIPQVLNCYWKDLLQKKSEPCSTQMEQCSIEETHATPTTDSDVAVSSGEAGPSWPRANDVDSAAATAAVKSAGEARPRGIASTEPRMNPNSHCRGAVASRSLVSSGSVSLATV